jgi:hypothetical protein
MKSPLNVVVFVMFFFSSGCKDEGTPPPPPYVPTIQLSIEDASCTEAWLKIRLTDSAEPRTLVMKRDSQSVLTAQMIANDSVFIDENLLPRRTYTYRAFRLNGTTPTDSSTAVQVTTKDTTSHNFTFQLDTLGVGNGSILWDVAIINDTLAYAVGEMYLRDSSGQFDPQAYNVAKWDGHAWELMRIQFFTFCGQPYTGSYPAKAIFAFGPQDVWIGMDGSQVVRWNGQSQSQPVCTPVSINRLWGDSPNSLYAVGYGGGIAHYGNGIWQRVESGTTLDVQDVWGAVEQQSGVLSVLCVASNRITNQGNNVLRIEGNSVVALPASGLPWSLRSLWFTGRKYYIAGDGLFRATSLAPTTTWQSFHNGLTLYYSNVIRGQNFNDVIVAGAFGDVLHFNGHSWKSYTGREAPSLNGSYYGTAIRGNKIMAVGMVGSRAIVLRGTRL